MAEAPTLQPHRDIVLVVDDSPDTLSFLTDAIERSGATVLVAVTVPAPPEAALAGRMVTLATPFTSVSAVPDEGENTARLLSVAKVTIAFGTGFLFASSTVALTVSGVALGAVAVVTLASLSGAATWINAGVGGKFPRPRMSLGTTSNHG